MNTRQRRSPRHPRLPHPVAEALRPSPIALAVILLLASRGAAGLPVGGQVVSGQATIQTPAANQQLITQGTQRAIINWSSFSIAGGEVVRFAQPASTSLVLNRVTGYDPSRILGQMQANGRVFLVNPNGVVFGKGARVDAGALVASTLNLSNADFMAGMYRFDTNDGIATAQRGAVVNDGVLSAPGGLVALVAPQVVNRGTIDAPGGRVGLAAAERVLVDVEGDGLILFQVDGAQAGNRLEQIGRIQAAGGTVDLRAAARGAFAETVLNVDGVVQANSLGLRGGRVVIDGGDSGITRVGAAIDVSGTRAGERGGSAEVLGHNVLVDSTARIDARGASGGGTVLVGGNWQGHGPQRNAEQTIVAPGGQIDASATEQGAGGTVVVWSDVWTQFYGSVLARGGASGGDGGRVETSGKEVLSVAGSVDASAIYGRNGEWLLDPRDVTISTLADFGIIQPTPPFVANKNTAVVNNVTLADALKNNTNVTVSTGTTGTQAGDIAVIANVAPAVGAGKTSTLTLDAAGDITIADGIAIAPTTGSLDVALLAGGTITFSKATSKVDTEVNTAGGNLSLVSKGNISLQKVTGVAVLDINNNATGTITINQDITTTGNQTYTGGVTVGADTVLSAGTGAVKFTSTVGGANSLTVNTGGLTTFAGAVSGLTSLTTDAAGTTSIGANITTTGAQTYNDPLTLTANATLGAGSGAVAFASTVGGAQSLTVNTSGLTTFAGTVSGLTSLTTDAAGKTSIGASIATTGTQTYKDAVTLAAATPTLSGTTVTFGTTLDGAQNLTVTGNAVFGSGVGTGTPLAGLTVSGSTTLNGTSLFTTKGDQTYKGAVTVDNGPAALTATDANITLEGKLNSANGTPRAVTVTASGDGTTTGIATFTGAIGGTNGLSDLTVLADNMVFTAAGPIGGNGTAALAPATAGRNIGLTGAGAPGDLLLSQPTLDKFAGFAQLAIGSNKVNGNVTGNALNLPTNTLIDAGTATIILAGAVDAGAKNLELKSTNAAADAVKTAAAVSNAGTFTITGNGTLGGGVTSTGTQTYTGALALAADAVLDATTAKIALGGAVDAATKNLELKSTNAAADAVKTAAAVNNAGTFKITGKSTIGGNVTSSGTQTYTGALALTANAILDATAANIALGGAVDAATKNLELKSTNAAADAVKTAAAVSNAGTFTITGNGSLGGGVTSSGTQTYTGTLALTADAVLDANTAKIALGSAVNAATKNLELKSTNAAADAVKTAAAVNNAGTFKITGKSTLGGSVTSKATQTYTGAVTLAAAPPTLTGSTVSFGSTLDGAQHLTISADAVFGSGVGTVTPLNGLTVSGSTRLNGGSISTGGNQSYKGAVTVAQSPATFTASNANITLGGTLDSADTTRRAVTVTASGDGITTGIATFSGAIGGTNGLSDLTVRADNMAFSATGLIGGNGTATLTTATAGHNIGLAGAGAPGDLVLAQATIDKFAGFTKLVIGPTTGGGNVSALALKLPTDTVIAADKGSVTFTGTVDGAKSLTVNSSGLTTFAGAVSGLTSLTTDAAGTTAIGADISTTGAQTFNDAVTLTAPSRLTASTVTFATTLDGAQNLAITGDAVFGSGVGTLTPLIGLTVGGSAALKGPSLISTGDQTYTGAVTLKGDTTIAASNASFKNTIDGPFALVANVSGKTFLGGKVGAGSALKSITVTGNEQQLDGGTFTTEGAQSYSGAVSLGKDSTFTATDLTLGSSLAINLHELVLNVDTYTLPPATAGGNSISLAPSKRGTKISVAFATPNDATDYEVSQEKIDANSGFSLVRVGRSDGTGTITVSNLTLPTSVLLQSSTGSVTFNGTVNTAPGAVTPHDLSITTGGLTTVNGPIGAQSALGNLNVTGPATFNAGSVAAASSLKFDGSLTIGGGDVMLQGDTMTFGSTLGGAGNLTLQPLSLGTTIGLAGGAGTLQLPQIAQITGLTSLTIGRADGSGAVDVGALTLPTDTLLRSGSGPISFGKVDGAHSLSVVSDKTLFGGKVGDTSALQSITVTGNEQQLDGGTFTTIGAQSYAGAVSIGKDSTFRASDLTLGSTLTTNGYELSFKTKKTPVLPGNSSGGSINLEPDDPGATISVAFAAPTADPNDYELPQTTIDGYKSFSLIRIGGSDGSGTITASNLTLPTNLLLRSLTGEIKLDGSVNTAPGAVAPHDLSITTGGLTTVNGPIGAQSALGNLNVTGPATFNAGSVAAASSLKFDGSLTIGGGDVMLQGDTMTFGSTLGGAGNLTLQPLSLGTTIGLAGGAGTLQLPQIAQITGLTSLTIGRADGSGAVDVGALTLPTDTLLRSGSGPISFGKVDGAHSLSVVSDKTLFGGKVGDTSALQSITVTGNEQQLDGGTFTTIGSQSYAGAVSLGKDSTFTATDLQLGSSLAVNFHKLVINADSYTLPTKVNDGGAFTIAPQQPGTNISIAFATPNDSKDREVPQSEIDARADFSSVLIGRSDGTGTITVSNLTLPTSLLLVSKTGGVTLNGSVNTAPGAVTPHDLSITTGGLTTVNGPIGAQSALGNLNVTGPATFNAGSVAAASSLKFDGSLTIGGGDVMLQGDTMTFGSTLGGAGNLTLQPLSLGTTVGLDGGAGTLQLPQIAQITGLTSLTIGRADGSGAVDVGALTLPTDTLVRSGSGPISFGKVDGAHRLTVNTAGPTTFGGAVGATTRLASLSTDAGGTTSIGANIATTGAQTYNDPVTLAADTILDAGAGSIALGGAVDAATHNLELRSTNAAADAVKTAAVSNAGTFTITGKGTLGGGVTSSGTQTYTGALALAADAVLDAGAAKIDLRGAVDAATHNLELKTTNADPAAVKTAAAVSNAGTFTITGNGTLGGNVTSSATQTYTGALALTADAILDATAAKIDLRGAVDAATKNLELKSTNAAADAVKTAAAVNNAQTFKITGTGTLGGNVTSSGAQTYTGALVLPAVATLQGGSLAFDGGSSGATDLTLRTDKLSIGADLSGSGQLTIVPTGPAASIGLGSAAGALQIDQATLNRLKGFTQLVVGRTDSSADVKGQSLTLPTNTTLQSGSGELQLTGAVDGGFDLTLKTGGATRLSGNIGATAPLRSLHIVNDSTVADGNATSGERTLFDGDVNVSTTGAQTYDEPVFTGGRRLSMAAGSVQLNAFDALTLGNATLGTGGSITSSGVLTIDGALKLDGGTLALTSTATPTAGPITDPEYANQSLLYRVAVLQENSATIKQTGQSTIVTNPGSLLALRSPGYGSILLEQPGNQIAGGLSAVSGKLGDNDASRFNVQGGLPLGVVRVDSSSVNVVGRSPEIPDQALLEAGIEADVIRVTADSVSTGPNGLIRARLPFDNTQGSQTSLPAVTFEFRSGSYSLANPYGAGASSGWIQVKLGDKDGGYVTVRPKGEGATHPTTFIFLGGDVVPTPFYDGSGKTSEITILYNGDAPRTPQEVGALNGVTAVVENARRDRFDEAVRTENVAARLRSGVIAEVGAGRPATEGRETMRAPDLCAAMPGKLQCR